MENLCKGALSPCWGQAAFSLLESKITLSYSKARHKTTSNTRIHFLWPVTDLLRVGRWERCEVVGEEHMVFFWGLVRFTPGSNFPTRSVVDTEENSNCSSGWPSSPQLICMPLISTLDWRKRGIMSNAACERHRSPMSSNLYYKNKNNHIRKDYKAAVSDPKCLLYIRNLIKSNP